MKNALLLLLACLLAVGCSSTRAAQKRLDNRKAERATAYSQLSPEMKAAVDRGEIMIGMPMDAVYIAWGKPTYVQESETAADKTTTWTYVGTHWHETHFWGPPPPPPGPGPRFFFRPPPGPMLHFYYVPHGYTRAEVIFDSKGVVKEWSTTPSGG